MALINQIKNKISSAYVVNIIFIAIIFVLCLWDVGLLERIRVVDDGFCYWGIAANISGYDWSELISQSSYYSYGYSLILIPLFWLHRLGITMTVLYRIAIVLNAFFLSGCYLITLYMLKELFEGIPVGFKRVLSLFVTLYIGNMAQMGMAWTETFLLFMFWCVVILLYRVIKKPGYRNILGLTAASAYMFAVHMRSIGVVIAVCMVMTVFFISRRKEINKNYIIYTAIVAMICAVLAVLMKNYVMNNIYMGTAAGSSNNVQAGISRIGGLLSIRGIMDLAVSFIGKLYYVSTASFLLIPIGALAAFVYLFSSVFKKKGYVKRKKWQLKEWIMLFVLLSFLAEIAIESIFQCLPFFRTASSQMRDDSFAFGRYADFVMGPMIALGILTLYNVKEHYKEIMAVILMAIATSGIVQFFYNVLEFRKKRDIVGFRFAASPWLAMLADGHKTNFACEIMMISIGVMIVFCMLGLFSSLSLKRRTFGAVMLLLGAIWGTLGVIGGMDYTESKIDKKKTVDTVSEIVKVTKSDVPIYMFGEANTEVKILQWILADRSIHICEIEEIDNIDIDSAIILSNSSNAQIAGGLSDRLDFLYDSGYLSVYAPKSSKYYKSLADKAEEMTHATDPTINSIELETVTTEHSYTKTNGGLYFSDEVVDEGYMTEGMGLQLEDGIYEFDIDMRVRECQADTEIGYITVGDADGNVQYTKTLKADDFIYKERQIINLSIKIENWAEPVIGIYTYGNAEIKICGISYYKVDGCICLDSDEMDEIAAFVGQSDKAEVYYIDSDNSASTGFPWWSHGELNYISGAVVEYKEIFEAVPYIVEKTDEEIVNILTRKLNQVYETENYIIFNGMTGNEKNAG